MAFHCLPKGCSHAVQNSFFSHADKLGLGLLSSLPAVGLLSSLPALKGTRSKSCARNPYEELRHLAFQAGNEQSASSAGSRLTVIMARGGLPLTASRRLQTTATPNVARQTADQVLTAIVDFDELLLAFKAVAHGGIIARRRRLRWAAFSLRRAGLSDPRFEVSLYASAMKAVPIVSSMPTTIPNRRFMAASSVTLHANGPTLCCYLPFPSAR